MDEEDFKRILEKCNQIIPSTKFEKSILDEITSYANSRITTSFLDIDKEEFEELDLETFAYINSFLEESKEEFAKKVIDVFNDLNLSKLIQNKEPVLETNSKIDAKQPKPDGRATRK